jgi:hypothetical protein
MIRAYDTGTGAWTNLLEIDNTVIQCDSPGTDIPRGRPF